MHRCSICRTYIAGALLVLVPVCTVYGQSTAPPAAAQADTSGDDHSPRGALWRAAVLPGWGQFYNDQYVKIPVVYAGLGGLAALAYTFNDEYLTYRHAYLYQAYQSLLERGELDTHPYPQYHSEHERLIERTGALPTDVLKQHRDKLRRNRDLMYIGLGIAYGLSIVDAYVSAHLADFDVSDDLSLQLHPGAGQLYVRFIFNQ